MTNGLTLAWLVAQHRVKMQRGVITYMTFFMFTAGAERLTKSNLNTEVHTSRILVLTSSLGSADFRGHNAVVQQ